MITPSYEDLYEVVKKHFLDNGEKGLERWNHTLGVIESSTELVLKYDGTSEMIEKAKIASLCHDYAKFLSIDDFKNLAFKYHLDEEFNPIYRVIYHGYLGYLKVKEDLNVNDEEILNAIKYHTTGNVNMTFLEKVVYIADFIEKGRVGKVFEDLRKVAFINLDEAVYLEAKNTYEYLQTSPYPIFGLTVDCYNYYKEKLGK